MFTLTLIILLHNPHCFISLILFLMGNSGVLFCAECDAGLYGTDCLELCDCPDGVSCDQKTGKCLEMCAAGFYGEGCGLGKRQSAELQLAITATLTNLFDFKYM